MIFIYKWFIKEILLPIREITFTTLYVLLLITTLAICYAAVFALGKYIYTYLIEVI